MRFPFVSPCIVLLLTGLLPLSAKVLHVDPLKGDDAAVEGQPLRTIRKAISLARAGDVIEIAKVDGPVHEGITIADRSGTREQPIVIEGNGVELLGTAPLPAEYEVVRPGVYRFPGLLKRIFSKEPDKAAIGSTLGRFFTVWDGKPNRMGRVSKGNRPALPTLEALKPGEWTVEEETLSLVIALEPDRTPEMEKITFPVISNGVALRGNSAHWVIRNVNIRQVLNDGFNLHGASADILFENISATECGDDGISAHGTCELKVNGFVGRRNSTGICHIDDSRSEQENVTLVENLAYNLMLIGSGEHSVKKSTVGVAGRGVRFGRQKEGVCRGVLEEVKRQGGEAEGVNGAGAIIAARSGSDLLLDRVELTQVGARVEAGAKVELRSSRIDAPEAKWEIQPDAQWVADHNRYRLGELLWNGQVYSAANFAEYQAASSQDKESRW